VSKKTIAFTMPTAGPRPRERAPVVLDALARETAPFAASDVPGVGDAGIDKESDKWVRDRDVRLKVDPAPAPPSAREAGVTIDLAAERSLTEVVSLSLIVPFALGLFWFVNAMSRRIRLWGA
jgi:hypothetical protein